MLKIHKKKKNSFGVDMAPMINVVFLLLIFFMLTSSALNSTNSIQLPESQTAEKIELKNPTVLIHPDGRLLLEGKPVSRSELLQKLLILFEGKENPTLEIQADVDVPFEQFSQVIQAGQAAGIQDYIFATDTPQKTSE